MFRVSDWKQFTLPNNPMLVLAWIIPNFPNFCLYHHLPLAAGCNKTNTCSQESSTNSVVIYRPSSDHTNFY